jgi:tyrosine-protein phosphatase YwqE
MRVDIERVRELKAELRKINDCKLEDLQIFESGKEVVPNPELLASWKYTGLNNTDYILMEYYKEGDEPVEDAWVELTKE